MEFLPTRSTLEFHPIPIGSALTKAGLIRTRSLTDQAGTNPPGPTTASVSLDLGGLSKRFC
jgi:hypothetical protein